MASPAAEARTTPDTKGQPAGAVPLCLECEAVSFDGEDFAVGEVIHLLIGGAAEAHVKRAAGKHEAAVDEDVDLIEEVLALGFAAEFFERP